MAEAKDQTKQSDEKISDGNLSMTDLKRLIDATIIRNNEIFEKHLIAAKFMMSVYLSFKEAGFTDEQAFKVVLTLLENTVNSMNQST